MPAPADSLVVDLCQAFLRIPSPSGGEGALGREVARRMVALGFQVEVDRFGTVLGRKVGGRPGPTLLLDGHMDTVPVTNPEAWTVDPHGGELRDGRLWGRGAADTKGSLAAMIAAGAAAQDFAGTLLVAASVCEENLTTAAVGDLLDHHPVDLAIMGEPTSLKLGVAQKGRAGVVLESRGRSAHTSRPELGDNAITKLMEALARVRALPLPEDPQLGRGVCELIEIASEPRPSPGMVPHFCQARLALRILPGETEAMVLGRLQGCLEGLEGITLSIPELRQTCDTGAELVLREWVPAWTCGTPDLQARLLKALGTEPFAAPYTTNASAAAARGIPTYLLGPGSIEQAHTVDEWVDVDQLEGAEKAYGTLLEAFLSQGARAL